ncbi:Coproporphyrinogen III oxidase [Gongronella butleri]|nr:Coproporphyrinogen III oxidase [Gongronella butleri]
MAHQAVFERDNALRAQGTSGADAPMRLQMEAYVKSLQQRIVSAVEAVEQSAGGGAFTQNEWAKPDFGGHGITAVLQDGHVMEKAGVAVSVVYSTLSEAAAKQMRPPNATAADLAGRAFFVTGISLVMHGKNPHVPTVHMNYRYFEVLGDDLEPIHWWFGGGADLTPVYLYEDDAVHFHRVHKDACDEIDASLYAPFKRACDDYFYNAHRGEARGIGGIFFDDLHTMPRDTLMKLITRLGDAFLPAYLPLLEKRRLLPFSKEHVHWQQLRRGRYVEFNLIHDRGTKFGLSTPCANTEAIFMTMPLTARWEYKHAPEPDSPEAKLEDVLKHPRNWAEDD